jgi:hypothetical protein
MSDILGNIDFGLGSGGGVSLLGAGQIIQNSLSPGIGGVYTSIGKQWIAHGNNVITFSSAQADANYKMIASLVQAPTGTGFDIMNGAAANDDGEFYYSSGWQWVSQVGNVVYFGMYGGYHQWCCFRFALPVAIPAGSTIDTINTHLKLMGATATTSKNFFLLVTDSADAAQAAAAGARPAVDGGSTAVYPNVLSNPIALSFVANQWTIIPIGSLVQYLVDTYSGLAAGAHICVWIAGDALSGSTAVQPYEATDATVRPQLSVFLSNYQMTPRNVAHTQGLTLFVYNESTT